jgi:phosphoglycerate dehydrogenase-like enzyme
MSVKPIIVIQGAAGAEQIPGIAAIAPEAELRFADSAPALARALPGAQILLGWNFKEASLRDAWPHADQLRWIHWTGAGVDAVLFPELVQSDVVLTNSRGIFDRAMAEYVLGLILLFSKRFQETFRDQQQHQWRHRLTEVIQGQRALIVGVGSIGREIGRLLSSAGLHVEGVGRRARSNDVDFAVIHAQQDLDDALSTADYVIVVVPLTPDTRGLIGAAQLRAMKTTARLINVARGAILDEPSLVEALQTGQIAGAALDVTTVEPLVDDSPLWDMPQVIISPHMSGDFFGHYEALASLFMENFQRFRGQQPLLNVVDKAAGFVASIGKPKPD